MTTRKKDTAAEDTPAADVPQETAAGDTRPEAEVVGWDDLDDVEQPNLEALPEGVAHRRRVQYGEYGQWIAAYDIRTTTNSLAYTQGHPVPLDNVDNDGRVVIDRHYCDHPDGQRCELFNQPTAWSEAGAAVRPPNFQE